MKRITPFLVVCLALASCIRPDQKAPELQAPLFDNLGAYTVPVTTENSWARKFFDQGLNLTFGFNHAEALRAFKEAQRLDPEFAMAYWGHAYVLGPNYNAAMDPTVMEEAYKASQIALELSKNQPINDWEKALIEALVIRYPEPKIEDRTPVDSAYAESMKSLSTQFSDNELMGLLTAESIMDVHPWDLWLKDGSPQPWTPEILTLLEGVIEKNPKHPGAHHLYIHATEASKNPQKGLGSADVLAGLVPGSGHLVHMPSHTYIRTGNYYEGTVANEKAVEVDSLYIVACNAQGMYPLVYYPHNIHFLAACAALGGQGEKAVNASYLISRNINQELMEDPMLSTLQHYWIIPMYVLVKFAQWDHLLAYPEPKESLLYPRAIWHYARGMALAGKNQTQEAKKELEALQGFVQDSLARSLTIWDINSVGHLMDIAVRVLEAKLLTSEKQYAQAIALLEEAVAIEDQLNYQEPPDWFFSVRHELGAVYLLAGQYTAAEKVYSQDLEIFPQNGWALNGLLESLNAQAKTEKAKAVETELSDSWKWADVQLAGSQVDESSLPSFVIQVPKRSSLPEEALAIRSICRK